ncbi:DEAD/DEAH box helicase family protein [Roseomonas populi]|uniref:SRP54-type proteins GTP-binding domain-containing protein n=1 Tax=Roseomonas populi TaxID=3121582 RepID=A0ABT1X7S9_9PROT|nr:hypothetical protein [Roseomonas pecuniae]MCR0984162.1 hypothetical protein [Roseomonas pecuniae]
MSKTTKATVQTDSGQPILLIAVGRQRVGKTVVLNALAQHYQERGADLRIWNADLLNQTHSISKFHTDALIAPPGNFEDTKAWIEERLQDQIANRYDAILDVGGGETALNRLAEEVQLVETMELHGIRPVALHVIGPDIADTDYLNNFLRTGLFAPAATILVMNEGLVTTGRSANIAFARVQQHPVVLDALAKGADIALLPALGCMGQVTDRGLTFSAMARAEQAPGHEKTSLFDQARVGRWWNVQMPEFFGSLRPEWMPRVPAAVEAAE